MVPGFQLPDEVSLGGDVRFEAAVPVQVVWCDVEDDGDTGVKPLRGFELEGRDLEDGHIEGLRDEGEGRGADVARRTGPKARRVQHGFDHANRGGFAIGARHRDDGNLKGKAREFDVARNASPGRAIALRRDAGTGDDPVMVAAAGKVSAGLDLHPRIQGIEAFEFVRGAFVRGHDPRSLFRAEVRTTAPAHAEAEHENAVAGLDGVFLRHDLQRSFSDESATRARMIDTIQKRTTIFCSGQPSFS